MKCFDCAVAESDRDAVGMCHDCGAGLCANHAVIRSRHLNRIATINRPIPVEPPARLMLCQTCVAAHDALHNPSHPNMHSHHRQDRTQATP